MLKDFRAFLMQGTLVTIAVAFTMGGAFAGVTRSFGDDLVNPFLAMFGGKPAFDNVLTIHGAHFQYGASLTAMISFVITVAVVFFLIVKPLAAAAAGLTAPAEPAAPAGPSDEARRHQELLRGPRRAPRRLTACS